MDNSLTNTIKALAYNTGYTQCGIASADAFEEFHRAVEQRIQRFPEASKLYSAMRKRSEPRAHNPWAQSIVVCIRRYGKYETPPGLIGHIGRTYLFDRRNPDCPDHYMPKKMKKGLQEMGLRVKQGCVPDRWAAARAGIARFGKNCFAYSKHGSWINIESWLVDAELSTDIPSLTSACPEGCRACIDACPTNALVEPFVMRMDRCIAYLTSASPEPVSPELWDKMGRWIYGCDKCQEVCPLNRGAWENIEKPSWLESIAPHLKPEALASMDHSSYRDIILRAFWYIPEDNIARWHSNAKRALKKK